VQLFRIDFRVRYFVDASSSLSNWCAYLFFEYLFVTEYAYFCFLVDFAARRLSIVAVFVLGLNWAASQGSHKFVVVVSMNLGEAAVLYENR